jgi:WD40 repeat protein
MQQEQAFEFGVLPRAIDSFKNEKFVVGLRTGSIVETDMATGQQTTIMEGHNDGEVWGLDMDAAHVYTTGDDNQVKKWDPAARKCVDTACVNEQQRKARRNRASTLGSKPDSQSSRAVAVNNVVGHVAVCANDGSVTVRTLDGFKEKPLHELTDSLEWIEAAEYSPDGNWLAVASHDTNIYIYDVQNGYGLAGKASKHNAAITCLDWCLQSHYIRSVCNGYELLFFQAPGGEQDPSGASNTTGTLWASQHCKFGWSVDGVFPRDCDGSHINGVDMDEAQALIATGDDYGLVNVFRNPCRKGSVPNSYRGHSEHVVRVKFGRGDLGAWLFSIGGYDQTLMQWKKK